MSYTKGPWRYSLEPQPNGCPIIGANGLMIAMLAHSANKPEEKEAALANARIIAAAPEMLEALEEILRANHDDFYLPFGLQSMIEKAVDKAKGEK